MVNGLKPDQTASLVIQSGICCTALVSKRLEVLWFFSLCVHFFNSACLRLKADSFGGSSLGYFSLLSSLATILAPALW